MQAQNTVFISYRRTNIYHARAIYQDLKAHNYNVFLDFESIDSGSFKNIILEQIRYRAHFLVILTPSALERCLDKNDWLRLEIETAIDSRRNVIPIMFEGFDFKLAERYMTGKLSVLPAYNALRIPADYFEEAMLRLRTRFLDIPHEILMPSIPQGAESIIESKRQQDDELDAVSKTQLQASELFERGVQRDKNDYAG